jgi:hypothetical protein
MILIFLWQIKILRRAQDFCLKNDAHLFFAFAGFHATARKRPKRQPDIGPEICLQDAQDKTLRVQSVKAEKGHPQPAQMKILQVLRPGPKEADNKKQA